MTTPELPPLPSLPIYGRDDQEDLCALVGAVEARERILQARIAELEADAERYRWLRDEAPAGIGEMASVRSTHGPQEIDAAIDAARGKP